MSDTPPEPTGSGPSTPESESKTPAPSARRPRAPRKPVEADPGNESGSDAVPADDSGDDAATAAAKRRRRGSRGGRNRSAASRAAAQEASAIDAGEAPSAVADTDAVAGENGSTDAVARKPRRSPARTGAKTTSAAETPSPSNDGVAGSGSEEAAAPKPRAPRQPRAPKVAPTEQVDAPAQEIDDSTAVEPTAMAKPRIGDTRPVGNEPHSESSADDDEVGGEGGSAKKRRRRGGRRRGSKKPTSDATTDVEADAIELDEETLEKRRGKERNGRPIGRYLMCVQKRDEATQIAVLEGRNLIEHYVSRPNDDVSQIDGNIYMSKVQNVLPGMEAAFIDIGTPKNAVLYRGDVRYDADDVEGEKKNHDARIEQMIKAGQTIVTQVTKNPIGSKGARLTQEVSLPGRFVVLMPNSTTYGISKRLPDDERKRLRKTLDAVKPAQHGIIVRTAAEGVTADELSRDVKRLVKQWDDIEAKANKANGAKLLYREPDMAVRIIREEFNKNYRGVIIDDKELFEEVKDYVASISPELADRIEYFDREAEPLPLFERYHVHEQVHKALDRKVWLPSGGSLIIERTEALTVIDVNTGKNVGKSNLEETVFRNNLEAAEEIAHQLRLRDIGGIIVIDFIDMEIKKNRDEVLNKLRDALARDKTRTQAYPIGELGLVEMTRKRISEGLVESFSEPCPACTGRGFVLDESLLTSN